MTFTFTLTYVLGAELAQLAKPHETRTYQVISAQRGDGHGVFNKAVSLWKADVERSLAQMLHPSDNRLRTTGGNPLVTGEPAWVCAR
jgi:hypothetical protein